MKLKNSGKKDGLLLLTQMWILMIMPIFAVLFYARKKLNANLIYCLKNNMQE